MATDKFDLGYMKHIYEPIFKKDGSRIKAILEIGVFEGDSLREWHSRFPQAIVHGVDLSTPNVTDLDPNLVTIYSGVDAYSTNSISRFLGIRPQGYDLIIDDGPHTLESQLFFVRNYGSLLADDGIMVLEDIIHQGAREKLEEAIDLEEFEVVRHDMRNKQLVEWLLNRWQTGLDVIVMRKRKKVEQAPVTSKSTAQSPKIVRSETEDKTNA